MRSRMWLAGLLLGPAIVAAWAIAGGASGPAAKDAVFKMDDVASFDAASVGDIGMYLSGGQSDTCTPTPNKEVKAYPKLKSKQPLYGVVAFGGSPTGPAPTVRFHFVPDESGEEAPAADKPADKPKETPPAAKAGPEKEADKGDAKTEPPPKATSKILAGLLGVRPRVKYDLLYFDANRDLDLTNDPVVKLMKDPPKGLPTGANFAAFETVSVEIPLAPDPGSSKVRVLPLAQVYGPRSAQVWFTAASVRKGKIRLGSQEYTAILSYPGQITGRLDHVQTPLTLIPVGKDITPQGMMSTGQEWLGTMREVDGVLYQISASPSGDELRVGPYRGDFGVFEVSPVNKEIKDCGALGMFMGKDRAVVFGATTITYPLPEAKVAHHKLPVGDYTPYVLQVKVGKVGILLRQNYYSADRPDGVREPKPSIQIRKDKPLVLDFSTKPKVVFVGPPADKPVKTGQEVRVAALLIEPAHDLLIGGLEDRSRKTGDMKFMGGDGKPISIPQYASLDPDIVITDSTGKEVAKGKMPFG